jgi:hypothetical protein
MRSKFFISFMLLCSIAAQGQIRAPRRVLAEVRSVKLLENGTVKDVSEFAAAIRTFNI